MTSLLEIRDLHVWFDLGENRRLHAVRGVDFELAENERVGLIGESGCGKSTLLLAMMGLLPPSATLSGEIIYRGKNIVVGGEKSIRPYRWREIAFVPQSAMNSLNPVRRLGDQLVEVLRFHDHLPQRAAEKRARELLELVNISANRHRAFPHELSGGMRQRAAIALALACNPRILLADEPTTALDVLVQAQILELLARVSAEFGASLVLVTHDLPIIASLCGRAIVMYGGRFVEQASTAEMYSQPAHPYTAALIDAIPEIDDLERSVKSIAGVPPRLDTEPVGCSFAPRCRHRFDACAANDPMLIPLTPTHAAACLLHATEELPLRTVSR